MHPSGAFRTDNRALMEALVDEIGFASVFAMTPDGPRVARTPVLLIGENRLQFHLSRGNAVARHLEGMTALVVIDGPDAYISPRWYDDGAQVPTWNYVSLELEGCVRRMDSDGLTAMLDALSAQQEARISAGEAWTMDKVPAATVAKLKTGVAGFELEIQAWRPTFKLSQNKPADERERIALGLEVQGSRAIAQLMREAAI